MRQQGPQLLAEHLTGDPVLIIASAGVDQQSLSSLQSTLEATAADFKGTLVVTPKMRLAGEDATKMADLLSLPSNDRRHRASHPDRTGSRAMLATAGHSSSGPRRTRRPTTTTSTTTTSRIDPSTSTTTTNHHDHRLRPYRASNRSCSPTCATAGGWPISRPRVALPTINSSPPGLSLVVVSGAGATVPDAEFLLPVVTDLGRRRTDPDGRRVRRRRRRPRADAARGRRSHPRAATR